MTDLARFVGITSAVGGVGVSSLALKLGRALSQGPALKKRAGVAAAQRNQSDTKKEGAKVVYVSFDFLSSKGFVKGRLGRADLYDMYYQESSALLLFGDDSDFDYENLLQKDDYGLYYFTFSDLINPLQMQAEGIEKLFGKLAKVFDFVVVDVPSNCILGIEVLPYCDYVIEVFPKDESRKKYCIDHKRFLMDFCNESNIYDYCASSSSPDMQAETVFPNASCSVPVPGQQIMLEVSELVTKICS